MNDWEDEYVRRKLAPLLGVASILVVCSYFTYRIGWHIGATESATVATKEDQKRCEEIVSLHAQVVELNWQLADPWKHFKAGLIDAENLRQVTVKPEAKIQRLCTKIYNLSGKIEGKKLKRQLVEFAGAILRRQKGFGMVIEGYFVRDKNLIDEGRNSFTRAEAARSRSAQS